jgi:hypothetical protein
MVLQTIERGFVSAVFGIRNGFAHGSSVMAVHGINHVPAVRRKTLGVLSMNQGATLTVDGDAVVVVQSDQLVELPGAGQCASFVADAFHQATIAHEHIGVVVDDGVAGLIELCGQQFFGQRHAHCVGDALTQRAGGGFNARGDAHFGVAGGFAVQIGGSFSTRRWVKLVAGEVQQRINGHGARGRWTARSGHGWPSAGCLGLCCRCSPHKATAMSAMPMGAPG